MFFPILISSALSIRRKISIAVNPSNLFLNNFDVRNKLVCLVKRNNLSPL